MKHLYEKIYLDIKHQIETQTLNMGDMLPTESEIERIYNVSRAPVRQALRMLEQEKLIIRMPGRGTFISFNNQKKIEKCFQLKPFTKQVERDWEKITCQTFSVRLENPSLEVMNFFALQPTEQVIHVYRMMRVGTAPVVLCHHYLKGWEKLEKIRAEGDFFSILKLVKKIYGVETTSLSDKLHAVNADGETARKMKIKVGHPLMQTVRFSYCNGKPVLYDRLYINTDLWQYSIKLQNYAGEERRASPCC